MRVVTCYLLGVIGYEKQSGNQAQYSRYCSWRLVTFGTKGILARKALVGKRSICKMLKYIVNGMNSAYHSWHFSTHNRVLKCYVGEGKCLRYFIAVTMSLPPQFLTSRY
jgi:hypothetical protein